MNTTITSLRDIALLREPAYVEFRDRKDAMKRGFAIMLACFLIAGLLVFLISLVNNVRPFGPEQADTFRQEFLQNFEQWQQFGTTDPAMAEFMDQFEQNFEVGLRIAAGVDSIGAPLPRGIAGLFRALGQLVTNALSRSLAILGYGIWVLLFAKLMGGNGGVDRFLGLIALSAIPNLLSIFAPIPCVGPLVALVGWVWGIAVYVRGVQVSQRFTVGKAVAATLLPALIVIAIAAILSIMAFTGLLVAIGQSG